MVQSTTQVSQASSVPGFFQASILLLVFNNLASGIHLVFQSLMGHHLTTEEFGLMNSLFQLGALLALPITIYASLLTRTWAEFQHAGREREIDALWCAFVLMVCGISAVVSAIAYLLSPWVAWWLNTSQISLVRLTILGSMAGNILGLALPFSTARQWFSLLAAGTLFNALFRVGLAWVGIHVQQPLLGGLLATFFYPLGFFLLILVKIRWKEITCIPFRQIFFKRNDWGSALLLSLGTFFILGSDLLVVKRVYPPEEAGLFSQVSILGRIIFYLIGPLTLVVFPKSATSLLASESIKNEKVLRRSLGISLLILSLAAIFISLLAPWLFIFLKGPAHPVTLTYLRIAVWCFIPISLSQLITPALFARRQEKFLLQFTFLSSLLPLGIFLFHQKLLYTFLVEGITGLLLLCFVVVKWKGSRSDF